MSPQSLEDTDIHMYSAGTVSCFDTPLAYTDDTLLGPKQQKYDQES